MSGRELAKRLAPLRPATPVLYMSGHTDSETVHLKASGATIHLLQKPFAAGRLARKVRELLDLPQG